MPSCCLQPSSTVHFSNSFFLFTSFSFFSLISTYQFKNFRLSSNLFDILTLYTECSFRKSLSFCSTQAHFPLLFTLFPSLSFSLSLSLRASHAFRCLIFTNYLRLINHSACQNKCINFVLKLYIYFLTCLSFSAVCMCFLSNLTL